MTAAEFAKLLPDAKRGASGQWSARCPAHDDRRASLSFADGERGLVLKCHAACTVARIAAALGLRMSALFTSNGHDAARSTIRDEYP